jgi:hypothetical protein
MDQERTEFSDFEAFWPHFLANHTNPMVRYCHVAALGCGLLGAGMALRKRRLSPLLRGVGAFAALGILSHPVFTGHWPRNFGYPQYAARGFLRLCIRTVTGAIHEDLAAL